MEQWSVTEVAEWVATAEVGHEGIASNCRRRGVLVSFWREKVDGEALAEVPEMPLSEREQFLQALGFVGKGPMMKFVMKIKRLKKPKEVREAGKMLPALETAAVVFSLVTAASTVGTTQSACGGIAIVLGACAFVAVLQCTVKNEMRASRSFKCRDLASKEVAGSSGMKEEKLDQYGSRDSFRDYKVLIGIFYHSFGLPADLRSLIIPELEKKGFQVLVRDTLDTFTSTLRAENVHVAWIISGGSVGGNVTEFLTEVRRFHEAGRGLMVWGDNDPWFAHANHVLKDLFNFKLTGETAGGKLLFPGDPDTPGCFDRNFKVCAGIERIFEGYTICYPTTVPPGWRVFGTSSNHNPVLLAKEASSEAPGTPGTGRVIVDGGFTKLFQTQWRSPGTSRYVTNCTAWLVSPERFRRPGWEFQ